MDILILHNHDKSEKCLTFLDHGYMIFEKTKITKGGCEMIKLRKFGKNNSMRTLLTCSQLWESIQ